MAIVILALWTIGCASVPSEQLRAWERHEGKANLLVFAHGFNSSRAEAWGRFIPLIKADKGFDEYDILSYGYPQQVCFQTNDIRDVGAHLKSELTVELPNYDTAIFVGHSMGGLVVLHALLELGGSNAELISNKRLRVMSLGTPYYGATLASIFGPYCPNSQAEAMKVLSKESARLMQDWRQRGKIPVFPFYGGLEDKVVSQASACGIAPDICESVDGDHETIAKPLDREHLTYRKLQVMKEKAGTKTVPPSEQRILNVWEPLVNTCGPSLTTTRPSAIFVPRWVSLVNKLRVIRNIHDLQNLMGVRDHLREEGMIPDLLEEAYFTLSCLERIGYLKMEKIDPPRMMEAVGGRRVENQKIIFLKPLTIVPE
ncbi:MAG: alpha/beta hydrolase [Nitrospiraceae bacterium]|nr:alpha/beta hydrolase [Nitrospiraceae bacterium]